MISEAKLGPGRWPYYCNGVMVGDGQRPAGKALRDAQDETGVPPGFWTGRGLAALGLVAGDEVTERQAELLLGEGRHPDADRIEAELLEAGDDPAKARRATVLGRPIEHIKGPHIESPWLAMDLVFRAPPTAQSAWALVDDATRRVLELCQTIARDKTLARMEESVTQIRWGSAGKHRAPVKDGLIIAVFRHYESRAGKPLLHDHAVVSVKARRPDGKWGNVSTADLLDNIVEAGTLYTLAFMEEVSARLGWAWEPREVTPGKRPVMEIAGIDQRLIGWQSTRRQQIAHALPALVADYEERQGHPPGERAAYALDQQAADRTRPPKRKEARSLSELREQWRASAIRAFGACTVYRLAERARAAAAAVWARVRPVVDITLAAVDTVAVVYVMRGAFKHRHLLAEARRHLSYVLRGRPHQPGLDEQIVQTVVDDYTRPAGRRMMTADLRALYPHEIEDQAVLRPLTRNRSAPPYERARLAAGALTARVHAARRADRLSSRSLPHTVALPAVPTSRLRPDRADRKAGQDQEQATDVATVEHTRRVFEAAAKMAAKLQDGARERAVAHGPRPQPAPAAPTPTHTQQPTLPPAPGRNTPTGGVA
ncbi:MULTISPECIES: MobF family relaxase [unclassified Streptomyces]|uniref:MobF family relaxase n=1 Tax=unclassified Streptomyces TaxID=2593676 RepID=UPI0029A85D7D|nr:MULTISPECIES: MobF family relaxase [unclassified Streptomyces]MDX3772077.1 MobF family relaxase [Streptomyces sp. AK08-01B]MDX3821602.1 MobF family relaxase [Streptomyces sp. AK08-01A]